MTWAGFQKDYKLGVMPICAVHCTFEKLFEAQKFVIWRKLSYAAKIVFMKSTLDFMLSKNWTNNPVFI